MATLSAHSASDTGGQIVSLMDPLDAAFATARRLNFVLKFVLALMRRKIMRLAGKRKVSYSLAQGRAKGKVVVQIK